MSAGEVLDLEEEINPILKKIYPGESIRKEIQERDSSLAESIFVREQENYFGLRKEEAEKKPVASRTNQLYTRHCAGHLNINDVIQFLRQLDRCCYNMGQLPTP